MPVCLNCDRETRLEYKFCPFCGRKIEETSLVTILVKSEKNGKICLAGVNENRRWVRPVKAGGFMEKDTVMDNGEMIGLFDVVEMKFSAPYPIKHHTENMLVSPGSGIKLAMKFGEESRKNLLSEIVDPALLDEVDSRDSLYNKMVDLLHQSLALVGPVNSFEIQSSIIIGKNHPRIWMPLSQLPFYFTCTDSGFCKFIGNKFAEIKGDGIISSQDVAELRGKQTYFVIGITGPFIDENGEIILNNYAPPGSSIQPRYWPMVVSVLTVPNYSSEE